jgi:hypothetical protein
VKWSLSLYQMQMQHTQQSESGTCWINQFLIHDDALAIDATIRAAKAFVGVDWFEGIYLWNMDGGEERLLTYVKLTPEGEAYLEPVESPSRRALGLRLNREEPSPIHLLLPPALKKRIAAAAKEAGTSLNAWAIRCFERCAGAS